MEVERAARGTGIPIGWRGGRVVSMGVSGRKRAVRSGFPFTEWPRTGDDARGLETHAPRRKERKSKKQRQKGARSRWPGRGGGQGAEAPGEEPGCLRASEISGEGGILGIHLGFKGELGERGGIYRSVL